MYGNCLTFALIDFLKNGGELCIEFWPRYRFPHFSVQRNNKRYDLEIVKFVIKELWYDGDVRETNAQALDYLSCKRKVLLKKEIKQRKR